MADGRGHRPMTPPNKTQQALPDGAERAFAAHAPPLASKEPSPPRPTVHLLNCMLLRVVRITSGVRSSGGLRSCDLEKFASLVTCRFMSVPSLVSAGVTVVAAISR